MRSQEKRGEGETEVGRDGGRKEGREGKWTQRWENSEIRRKRGNEERRRKGETHPITWKGKRERGKKEKKEREEKEGKDGLGEDGEMIFLILVVTQKLLKWRMRLLRRFRITKKRWRCPMEEGDGERQSV